MEQPTSKSVTDTLFETLQKLQNGEIKVDVAEQIGRTAQTILNIKKFEYQVAKDFNMVPTSFVETVPGLTLDEYKNLPTDEAH